VRMLLMHPPPGRFPATVHSSAASGANGRATEGSRVALFGQQGGATLFVTGAVESEGVDGLLYEHHDPIDATYAVVTL